MGAQERLEGKGIKTTLFPAQKGDGFISCFLCKNSMSMLKKGGKAGKQAKQSIDEFSPRIMESAFQKSIVELSGRQQKLSASYFDGKAASAISKGDHKDCADMGFVAQSNGYSLLGLFDGLGKSGARMARLCVGASLDALSSDHMASFREIIGAAHKKIISLPEFSLGGKPGAAAVLARIKPDGFATVCWIGDCRAYSVSKAGAAQLLTADFGAANRENLVLKFAPDGLDHLAESQKFSYLSQRNLLTSYIGLMGEAPKVAHIPLAPGDCLVLCSDGIGDVMTKRDISDSVFGKTPLDAARALVDLAASRAEHREYENAHGEIVFGKVGDDISAIVFKMP